MMEITGAIGFYKCDSENCTATVQGGYGGKGFGGNETWSDGGNGGNGGNAIGFSYYAIYSNIFTRRKSMKRKILSVMVAGLFLSMLIMNCDSNGKKKMEEQQKKEKQRIEEEQLKKEEERKKEQQINIDSPPP
ncbi:hypothetical protein [Treponema phagedenis]|uniref:hypothetical protein n=1 Tax=Treponema phagedenis TaxID=162 RepID=UPI001584170C|nr:hypothetical protein [Treponema phagedenis]QKS91980.1 hypothetical protein HPJ96_05005 [Treponema phagedenis]